MRQAIAVWVFMATALIHVACSDDQPEADSPDKSASANDHHAAGSAARGGRTQFILDADPAAWRRVGLFIGIDDYRHPSVDDLDGCVHDATRLRELFATRYGFKHTTLLTGQAATRAGISAAFKQLHETVQESKRHHNGTVSVVITYSGHGSRVEDDNGDEPDGLDETWVAQDSTMDVGENDIRDDELRAVYKALVESGCQVLLISDSCHSGSVYRAAGQFKPRLVIRDADHPAPGPKDDAFADFKVKSRGAASSEDQPLPGFVVYSACRDTELAWEARDRDGKPCGRLSYVLRSVLPQMSGEATYAEVYASIQRAFKRKWPLGPHQAPQFMASNQRRDAFFLTGGRPVPHAAVVPDSIKGTHVELNMGTIDGVSVGAGFVFYATLADLKARRSPVGRGEAVSVQPLTCKVKLDSGARVGATTKAALDMVRMESFVIRLDEKVGGAVKATLRSMAEDNRLTLAEKDSSDYTVSVFAVPGKADTLGVYLPTAEPVDGNTPAPIREIAYDGSEADALQVAEQLLYIGRIQRLVSLDYNSESIQLRLNPARRGSDGRLEPVKRREVDGVKRLIDGDKFTLTVSNKLRSAVFVTVLYMDVHGDLIVLYPTATDPLDERVEPGGELEIGRQRAFTAAAEDERQIAQQGFERAQIKVIASSRPIDIGRLVRKPQVLASNDTATRGAADDPDALHALLGDTIRGVNSRGIKREKLPDAWGTANLILDVEPAE